MKLAFSLAVISILSGLAVSLALAQPSYAQPNNAPPPSYAVRMDTIHGRIVSFDGHYALTVRDDRGYIDRIKLHDGTIINPRGLRLSAGMLVTVSGRPSESALLAYEIDTRYHEDPGYYGPGYPAYSAYPPYYSYYGCCYAPYYSFGIGLHFGGYGRHW
jgi:hypothetical protein